MREVRGIFLFLRAPRKGHFLMNSYDLTRMIIAIACILFVVVFFINKMFLKKKPITTKFMTRTAIFAAMAIILYIVPFLKFKLPFFPAFLEIHLDEIPLLIAGFAYGPLSALLALIVKTLVKLPMTTTLGVGELADFIYSAAFVIPAAIIYKKHRSFKGMLVSISISTVIQLLVSCFVTTFLILDFYMYVMNLPRAAIMGMIKAAGINIDSLSWPFFFTVALPFNAMKDAIVLVVTILIYKRIHKLVERATDRV